MQAIHDHVDPDVNAIAELKRRFLQYPAVNQIEKDFDRLLKYGSLGGRTGTSSCTYMLIGEPGSGKTALLTRLCLAHPKVEEAERDVHPVLYVQVPPKATRKALAERILNALGAFVSSNATEIQLTQRAINHLREMGVKILVLDEAQHLVIPEKKRLNYEAADWVKGVANAGVCAVVLAGVPDAWEAYLYNGQLLRRSFANRRLAPFRLSHETQWFTFLALAEAYIGLLPFEEGAKLASEKELKLAAKEGTDCEPEAAMLGLMVQSGGLMGRLSDFLVTAAIIGLETKAKCLDIGLLREAAEQQADLADMDWRNPFSLKAETLREMLLKREADDANAMRKEAKRRTRAATVRDIIP